MDNRELILCAVDILQAIEDNNIENAKSAVTTFNALYNENVGINMNDLLPLFELIEHYNEETYAYVVFNIANLPDHERLQWMVKVAQLNLASVEEVEEFILNTLSDVALAPNYIIASLIHLCVKHDRYDLLKLLRNSITIKE